MFWSSSAACRPLLLIVMLVLTLLPCLALAQLTPSLRSSLGDIQSAPLSPQDIARGAYYTEIDREYENRARRELAEQGLGEEQLRDLAIRHLKEQGTPIYRFQRIFVSGVLSASDDETEAAYGRYWDQRIALSFFDDEPGGTSLWQHVLNGVSDFAAWRQDRSGEASERSHQELKNLSGASINELYAHSWGTEAVYAAILDGTILPPNKLVLMGVPTRNLAKWEALSRATGTEVDIRGFDQDFASRLRLIELPDGSEIRFSIDDIPGHRVSDDPGVLAQAWNAWCDRNAALCHPRGHPGGPPAVLWQLPDGTITFHFVRQYFAYFVGQLDWLVPVQDMNAQQEHLIDSEAQKVVNAKVADLERRDPPPPFPGDAAVAAVAAPPAAAAAAAAPGIVPDACFLAGVAAACSSGGHLAALPANICGGSATVVHATPGQRHAALDRSDMTDCSRELIRRLDNVPDQVERLYGFFELSTLNQLAAEITRVASISVPAGQRCRPVCSTQMQCGAVTYENRCVSGACFNFPRQHCAARNVCATQCY